MSRIGLSIFIIIEKEQQIIEITDFKNMFLQRLSNIAAVAKAWLSQKAGRVDQMSSTRK